MIVRPLRPEHPLRKSQMPAQSGLWASRACYPTELQRHRRAVRSTEEMPLANLCNRLVVTSTLGVTPSPSIGLSPFRPPRPSSRLRPGGVPSLRPEAFLGSAGWPLLASPALGRPRSWCCAGQLLPAHHPSQGCAVSRAAARAGLVNPTRARWSGSQAPRVATRSLCPASRAPPREPGPASPHPNQRMQIVEPEAPSTNRSHRRRPSLRPNGDRVGRHWCPGFATGGPASDMLSRSNPRSARPKCFPAIRRGPEATCRLPASAMECPPSTPACCPILDVGRGKPRPAK